MAKIIIAITLLANILQFAEACLTIPSKLHDKTSFSVCFLTNSDIIENPAVSYKRIMKTVIARRGNIFREDKTVLVPVTPKEEGISDFPPDLKAEISKYVTISAEHAGISFYGWNDCEENNLSDLILIYANTEDITLTTGTTGAPEKQEDVPGKPVLGKRHNTIKITSGFLKKQESDLENTLQRLASRHRLEFSKKEVVNHWARIIVLKGIIHEVGHFLGLHHEHMRKEGYTEMELFDLDQSKHGFKKLVFMNDLMDVGYASVGVDFNRRYKSIGSYDIFSTMHYMWLFNSEEAIRLKVYCDLTDNKNICNPNYLKAITPNFDEATGFFSRKDIDGLRFLYLNEQLPLSQLDEDLLSGPFYKWMQEVRNLNL